MQTKPPEYITQQKKNNSSNLTNQKYLHKKKNQQRKTVIQLQPFPLLKKNSMNKNCVIFVLSVFFSLSHTVYFSIPNGLELIKLGEF